MTPPRIPERLRLIAERVLPGKPAADIGTDHAILAVYLVRSEHVPHAIASDVRSAPLEAARALISKARATERIELRLGSGIEVLEPGDAATVVIAGVGGANICRMAPIDELRELGVERLIIQASAYHDTALEHFQRHLVWRPELTAEGGDAWPWRIDVFDTSM